MSALAMQELARLERVTETVYPGRTGRWWYEEWGAMRLCEVEHPYLKKKAHPCTDCQEAMAAACDIRDELARRASENKESGQNP